jgi:hypothetical protein
MTEQNPRPESSASVVTSAAAMIDRRLARIITGNTRRKQP